MNTLKLGQPVSENGVLRKRSLFTSSGTGCPLCVSLNFFMQTNEELEDNSLEEKVEFSSLWGVASIYVIWAAIALCVLVILLMASHSWINPQNVAVQSILAGLQSEPIRILFFILGIILFETWLHKAYSNLVPLGFNRDMEPIVAIKKFYKSGPELYTKLTGTKLPLVIYAWYLILSVTLISAYLGQFPLAFYAAIASLIISIVLVLALSKAEYLLQHENQKPEGKEKLSRFSKIVTIVSIVSLLLVGGGALYIEHRNQLIQAKEAEFSTEIKNLDLTLAKINDTEIVELLDKLTVLDDSIAETSLPLSGWIQQLEILSGPLETHARTAKQTLTNVNNRLAALLIQAHYLPPESQQTLNNMINDMMAFLSIRSDTYDKILSLTTNNRMLISFTKAVGISEIMDGAITSEESTRFNNLLDTHDQNMQNVYNSLEKLSLSAQEFQSKLIDYGVTGD